MKIPLVHIIILNWNGYEVTIDCLKSLLKIDYENYQILVIDNGSNDGSVAMIESFIEGNSKINLLALNRNYGFSGGNNIGIEHVLLKTDPDYLLLLNNDTTVESNFLTRMVSLGNSDNSIAAVVPKIMYFDSPTRIWYAGGYINKLSCMGEHFGKNQLDSPKYNTSKSIDFMNGCAMLLKASVIKKIGMLDDSFFANCEDTEMSYRISKAGYKIMYQPTALIYHKVSFSFKLSSSNWFGYYLTTRNLVKLQLKYNKKKWYFIFGILYFISRWVIYLQLKFIMLREFTICKYIILGVVDGITEKLRLPVKD